MRHRHKKPASIVFLPKIWLMTDPRLGDRLLPAVQKLPLGSGVIFRHYDLPIGERRALFRQVARICRRRGHQILLAGDERTARAWHADGFHQRPGGHSQAGALHSAPAHNVREIVEAKRNHANVVFISPLHATRSHTDARPLGQMAFRNLAMSSNMAVIALGGMSAARARMQDRRVVHGWAAIDAFGKTKA